MVKDKAKISGKVWIALLVVLLIVIVGLVVGLVVQLSTERMIAESDDFGGIIEENMPGWEGDVGDSTKALIIAEEIAERLEDDLTFSLDDAIAEYKTVYDNSDGDLKVYIAIEYANYIYNATGNLEEALKIINEVEGLTKGSDKLESDYLYAIYGLYSLAGDSEKMAKYSDILEERFPPDQVINMEGDL